MHRRQLETAVVSSCGAAAAPHENANQLMQDPHVTSSLKKAVMQWAAVTFGGRSLQGEA